MSTPSTTPPTPLHGLLTEERMDHRIGLRLRTLRVKAGLSLSDLATRAGLPVEELADHEEGLLALPLSRAALLCRTVGITLEDLLQDHPPVSPDSPGCPRC